MIEWVNILLASISALLAILGLGIAVLAFFGYRSILKSAVDAAVDAATKKIDDTLPEFQKSILEEILQSGAVNAFYSVDKDVYKDKDDDTKIAENLSSGEKE